MRGNAKAPVSPGGLGILRLLGGRGYVMADSSGLLFNPDTYDPVQFDPETRRQLRAVIDWFEQRGKTKLLRGRSGRAMGLGLSRLHQAGADLRDLPDAIGVRHR